MENEYIFVYGTLRKSVASVMHQLLATDCIYIARGTLQGKLFEVADYPAAVESDNPKDKVHGELYRILNCAKVLAQLDDYEECSEKFSQPHEYTRKKVLISVSGAKFISAWVYIYNHDITNLQQIKSGDYCLDI